MRTYILLLTISVGLARKTGTKTGLTQSISSPLSSSSHRNIEDILSEKGEEVLKINDSTIEVKGQDVVGSHKLNSTLQHIEKKQEQNNN